MKSKVVIQWSEEDACFVVFLPEFEDTVMQPVTYGDSYEEALDNAEEVLELLSETSDYRTIHSGSIKDKIRFLNMSAL